MCIQIALFGTLKDLLDPGGGGALDFHVDGGGVPLGVENLTLSQCARCTKYTPCHNIPC